jgi:hypothetical protein
MLNDNVISGQTELAHADIASADELMISDGGVLKKVGLDSLRDHYFGQVSGDATVADGGALTIGTGVVEHAMLAGDCIDGDNIQDDVVNSEHLAAGAIDTEHLADNQVTLAKMAGITRGSIISGDASGDPQALAVGSAHQFLQSDGTDLAYVSMSGDATLAAGVLSIGATKVTDAMMNDDVATGLAGVGLGAASGVMALDLNELSAAAIDVSADSFALIDANDSNGSKKESIADFMTAIAGTGLKADAGVLEVRVSGSIIRNSDKLGISGSIAGDGLKFLGGVNSISALEVDLNEMGAGAVAVGADHFVFVDADDGITKKESFADFATAVAGAGLGASSGVLSLDIDELDALGGTGVAQGDHFVFSDGGTEKKITFSNLQDAVFADVSGDATIAAGGALTIAAQAVENSMLADDAVGADELAANAVVEASIVDNAVSLAKMAGLARGKFIVGDASGDPSALAVGTAHQFLQSDGTDLAYVSMSGDATLAAGVLTIGAGRVVNAMLADDAVGADELAANAVVNASVASGAAIAYSKMEAVAAGRIMVGDGSNVGTIVAVSGDVTMSNAGAVTIAANAVEGSMLNTNAISGQTALASGLAATDELMVSDAGTLKRMDISVLSAFQAGPGISNVSGEFGVDYIIDTVIGSNGHNYADASGVYTLSETALTGSEMVYLNGQMLMPGASLSSGDYTTATGSVELHRDLKLDADDVLRVYYLK